ncbi:MAG: hypothetical protein Fur006_19120 [Coleofasciculaceae cyanobacterium]
MVASFSLGELGELREQLRPILLGNVQGLSIYVPTHLGNVAGLSIYVPTHLGNALGLSIYSSSQVA